MDLKIYQVILFQLAQNALKHGTSQCILIDVAYFRSEKPQLIGSDADSLQERPSETGFIVTKIYNKGGGINQTEIEQNLGHDDYRAGLNLVSKLVEAQL